jgi:hypothetical protein
MSATFDRSAFLRRLAISIGVVSISTLPLLRVDFRTGLVSPWSWLGLLEVLPSFSHIHAAVFVVATLAALAAAAIRSITSTLVTLWFAANALGLWLILWANQSGPGLGR